MSPRSLDTSISLLERLQQEQLDQATSHSSSTATDGSCCTGQRAGCSSEADAHDVTQEVLLSLVRQMREFRYDPAGAFGRGSRR